jgi:hypothetical protein
LGLAYQRRLRPIGYANKGGKTEALANIQAAAVTTDLADITAAFRATPLA